MTKVLFVCTGNAGRSQMAAALFGKRLGDAVEVVSGGVEPWDDLHPVARELLRQRGYAVESMHPKHVRTFAETPLDVVVTIGDRAKAESPSLPGNPRRIHWAIDDPADADGTPDSVAVFHRTWELIAERMPGLEAMVRSTLTPGELHLAPGISTCLTRPERFEPAVHLPPIAAAGFRCIEVCCFLGAKDFLWDWAPAVRELRKVADDLGLTIWSVHAAGGLGPFTMGYSRQLAVDLMRAQADLAAELGAMVIPMHAGPDPALARDQAMYELHADLAVLEAHIEGMPCRYGWENEPGGLTLDEHLWWVKQMQAGGFCMVLDPGHSNKAGTLDRYLDEAGGLLASLHINDNDGTADQHRIPGRGTIDWTGFVGRIERLGYRGPLMLEILGQEGVALPALLAEAMQSLELLRG